MKPLRNPKSYDVIVAGAGMAGLGAAIGLAEKGRKVLVISKEMRGASTPAAGGILDPFLEMTAGHPLFHISQEAFLQYPSLVRRLESKTGKSTGYKKTGMLFIAMTHQEMRELEQRYAWQKKTGIAVQWFSRVSVLKKYPGVNPKLLAGLFYPTVARINPRKLKTVLQAYAELLGVRFLKVSASPELITDQKAVRGVRMGKTVIYTDAVVNAIGSWAGKGAFGPRLPVSPAKGQILLVRSKEKVTTILHSLDGGYIVPWNDQKLRGGYQEYLLGSTVERVGFKPETTRRGLERIVEKNGRILPAIFQAERVDAWAGLRPFSDKKVPLIGPTKIKGLYLAAGYYRSGVLIGCRAGELLAEAIILGKMPGRIKPFDPRRYSL